jgi:hypothetical protein
LKANHNHGQIRSARHQIHAIELSLTSGDFYFPFPSQYNEIKAFCWRSLQR